MAAARWRRRSIHTTFDVVGNVISQTDPLGSTRYFVYDNLNCLLLRTLPNPDGSGLGASSATTFTYNPRRQPDREGKRSGLKAKMSPAPFWPPVTKKVVSMKRIYDLAEDHELIEKVQRATLTTPDFGIIPEIAIYGSHEWWQAIEDGRIPRHVIDGVISDVFTSGESNWPQFEVDSNGSKTVWTRFGDPRLYASGQRVRLVYVVQQPKRSWTGNPYQNEVLSIDVEGE